MHAKTLKHAVHAARIAGCAHPEMMIQMAAVGVQVVEEGGAAEMKAVPAKKNGPARIGLLALMGSKAGFALMLTSARP